jgi:hypothetical protein
MLRTISRAKAAFWIALSRSSATSVYRALLGQDLLEQPGTAATASSPCHGRATVFSFQEGAKSAELPGPIQKGQPHGGTSSRGEPLEKM